MWSIEQDPCLRTTIVAVSLLDRSPDWDRLRARMTEACISVPRLRQRVVETPLRFGPPRWQTDDGFDLGFHLRRVVVPWPCDVRALLDLTAPIAMGAFDKDRPLWEFTLVEGLDGGHAAFVQKVHHSFTDGVGAVALARLLLDTERDPAPHRHRAHHAGTGADGHTDDHRTGLESIIDSITADLRRTAGLSLRGARALPGMATRAITDPVGALTSAVRDVRSIGKLVAPVTRPLSPAMVERGLSRRLDCFDIPTDALRAAGHVADGSLNDAFLASVAGGMRRYHDAVGAPTASLRVTMPINLRRPDDPAGSNRFTPARFQLPIDSPDPVERMRRLGELARGWRSEPALPLSDAIAGVLGRLPVAASTSIFGSMLKGIDFVATNVPGLRAPAYLAGAEVTREYAFAPPSGAAFSVALLSHGDQCCLGINADLAAVPDPELLTSCLREGFEEVVAVGGAATTRPRHTMGAARHA